jgi:hypothetical protein
VRLFLSSQIMNCRIAVCGVLAAAPLLVPAQTAATAGPVARAQKQITAYLAQLADLHCTETVTQEKLTANGHVEYSARAQFDYLIMMSGNGDEFQLNESRIESAADKAKKSQFPLLVTNGVSTILLVFHPYYRDGFEFTVQPEEIVGGREVLPIHFAHIPGRRTPAAMALRGRTYPLDLEGTAWLDRASGNVVKVEANLEQDMSDVGLRSLDLHVEYKPVSLSGRGEPLALPAVAEVEVSTPKQHWRNRHVFDHYQTFSTDVEQDANVKVRAENSQPQIAPVVGKSSAAIKEMA